MKYKIVPCCLFLAALVFVSSDVSHAADAKGSKKVTKALPKFMISLTDSKGKAFTCANIKANKWDSGYVKKNAFNADATLAKTLSANLKKARTAKAKKKLKATIAAMKARQSMCKSAGTSSPKAIANQTTGAGLEPIAVTLAGESGALASPLKCVKLSDPAGAKIEVFDETNCTALIRPESHLTTSATFDFAVLRLIDNKQSASAPVTINWDQNGAFVGDYRSLVHYKDSLSPEEVVHLVRWFGFGANLKESLALGTAPGGTDKLVDYLLTARDCTAVEAAGRQLANDFQARLTYDVRAVDPTDVTGKRMLSVRYATSDDSAGRLAESASSEGVYWLYMMRNGCTPAKETMGMFMHTQFPVNGEAYRNAFRSYITPHLALLRSNIPEGNGKVVAPFNAIVKRLHGEDGAMLKWLNNDTNQRGNFGNENYARELMELFVLGQRDPITNAENYNEENVYQLAFAVMGYTEETRSDEVDRQYCCTPNASDASNFCGKLDAFPVCRNYRYPYKAPVFSESRWNHPTRPDPTYLFEQFPFGKFDVFKANSLAANQDNLTDYLLFKHPGVGRFIGARLLASFATLEPTNEMVNEVAGLLTNNQFAFEPALKKILTSSAFYSAEGKHDCVVSPTESYVSTLRILDLPSPYLKVTSGSTTTVYNMYSVIRDAATESGEALLNAPSVFGYKSCGKITGNNIHDGSSWLQTQTLLARKNGMVNILNEINRASTAVQFNWKQVLPSDAASQRNPSAIINEIAFKLGIKLTQKESDILNEYMNNLSLSAVPDATKMATMSWATLTDVQFQAAVNLKIPGLLEIMTGMRSNLTK